MESSGNLSYNKGVKSDKNWVIEESRFSRRELKKIEAFLPRETATLDRGQHWRRYTVRKPGDCTLQDSMTGSGKRK